MTRGAHSYHVEEPAGLSLAARMRRRLRNLCQGYSSTATRNAQHHDHQQQQVFLVNNTSCSVNHGHHRGLHHHRHYNYNGEEEEEEEKSSCSMHNIINVATDRERTPSSTLEEMIMQLELEEKIASARKAAADMTRRMSCVNTSSDRVLRSARNALNQYPPRFSLDGKDAMYSSSFLNDDHDEPHRRRSSACGYRDAQRWTRLASFVGQHPAADRRQPPSGRRSGCSSHVVWCKPGVVPKLMGLDSIPVPAVNFPHHRGPLFLLSSP